MLAMSTSCLAVDRYEAVFDDDLGVVAVQACFDGKAPAHFYHHAKAAEYTQWFRHEKKSLKLSNGGATRLPHLPDDACLRWRVNLARAASAGDYRLAFRISRDLVVSTNLWFWSGGSERDLQVDVRLPEGHSISTPWPEIDATIGRFRPNKTPASWTARTAIGPFSVRPVSFSGSRARLAIVGDVGESNLQKLEAWASDALLAVSSVVGEFPQPAPQVLVVPIGRRNEAVPWAHVMRGGGPGVEFFVDETRSLDAFRSDWTAFHEFSHLLLPFVDRRDRWLSEGLASYYQNVLRARSGRLTEKEAWQKLHEGFRRGNRGTRGGTLAEITRNGRGGTMRIYWSGAAMMLMADARLRKISNGEQSLDTALKALKDCCFDSGKRWRAWEVMTELDRLTGYGVFRELYRAHVHDDEFPDVSDTFRELGLETRFDRVRLVSDAPLIKVRTGIMAASG